MRTRTRLRITNRAYRSTSLKRVATTHGGMARRRCERSNDIVILRIPSALTISTESRRCSGLTPSRGRVEESSRLSRVKTSRVEPSPVHHRRCTGTTGDRASPSLGVIAFFLQVHCRSNPEGLLE
ncbi:hypothetical protein ALC62_08206 [Cyphomyrmex costatus]|uniref:Uncharacterized protein n=1 Tax=Cyphomyrmex costatus TaxID=456900 RepID=A0A195CJS2_9HYME|nr:hypothetical protein ALC62_08206 [Cyphomyrmex costatus]